MTNLPLSELRLLAWQTLPCRYCNEPAGRRCVTSSGERTTPHAARINDIIKYREGQASRDEEVNALTERVNSATQNLTDAERALALVTVDRDDLRISLAAANIEITGLSEQNATLTRDLEATEAEYAAHMRTHDPAPVRMLVGAAVGGNSEPGPLEQALGRPLDLRRTYWGPNDQAKALSTVKADHAKGRIPYISFKTPYSWAEMAAGRGDAWADGIADALYDTQRPVDVVIHHEPEGDGVIADWVAMQRRVLPILRSDKVRTGICLTGYPQVTAPDGPYGLPKLWPGDMAQFLSVDIYQRYGTTDAGLKWTPLDRFFGIVAAFANSVGVPWGTGETGVTDEAYAANPDCLAELFTLHRKHGAEHLCYFNSSLNSKGSWPLAGNKLTAFVNQASPA